MYQSSEGEVPEKSTGELQNIAGLTAPIQLFKTIAL